MIYSIITLRGFEACHVFHGDIFSKKGLFNDFNTPLQGSLGQV